MKKTAIETRRPEQAERSAEERMQLLDTIREMIDTELGSRGREVPPPFPQSRRRSLWRRIWGLFTFRRTGPHHTDDTSSTY